jgi:hypothetical protein
MGGFLKQVTSVLGLQMFYPELKRVAVGLQVYFD